MSGVRVKRSMKNIITSFLSTVITIILGLIIPRLVLVNYGSETNGLVNSINQFMLYLGLFETGLGLTATQALYLPIAQNDKKAINGVLSALNKNYQKIGVLYLSSLLILSFGYPFLVIGKNNELSYGMVFLCVLFSGLGNVILFLCQGKYRVLLSAEGKDYILIRVQTLITVLTSLVKIFLINAGFNIVAVIISTFLINLIQVFYIFYIVNKKYRWIDLKCRPSGMALAQRKYVFLRQIAWLIFQNTDVLLLTFFCDLKTVSVYSMYKLIISNIQKILNIPIDSSSFAMGQIYNTNIAHYKRIVDAMELYYSSIYFAIEAVVVCLMPSFLGLYTAGVTDIVYVDKYLPVMFVIIELLTFMRMPMINTIAYAGHFKLTTPQTIVEIVLNLMISIVGVIKFGIYGVLLGTIIALLYRFIDVVFYSNIKLLKRKPIKTIKIYLMDIMLFILCLVIYYKYKVEIYSYADFLRVGVWCTFLFLAIYAVSVFVFFPKERKLVLQWIRLRRRN